MTLAPSQRPSAYDPKTNSVKTHRFPDEGSMVCPLGKSMNFYLLAPYLFFLHATSLTLTNESRKSQHQENENRYLLAQLQPSTPHRSELKVDHYWVTNCYQQLHNILKNCLVINKIAQEFANE